MDHEFFTHQLDKDQVGWDWFSLQLNDDTELMLYRIRRRDGSLDPHSSGTYIDVRGRAWHLDRGDFSLLPGEESWKSPVTQAVYPLQWRITLPKLGMELEVTTQLRSQELSGQSKLVPSYWEGTIDLKGHQGNSGLTGTGYLEMTGYDRAIALPQ
jgi:predicted secreted hydrolase